jgi:hypothetical protein
MSSKRPFFGQKPEFYFRVKKALFFICSAREVNDRKAKHSTLKTEYRRVSQHLKDTPVQSRIKSQSTALREAGRRKTCG